MRKSSNVVGYIHCHTVNVLTSSLQRGKTTKSITTPTNIIRVLQ